MVMIPAEAILMQEQEAADRARAFTGPADTEGRTNMDDKQLAERGIPGVGYAIAEAKPRERDKFSGWPATGISIRPERGGVGLDCYHPLRNVADSDFGCSYCGHGRQSWASWVSLARRILAANAVMIAEDVETEHAFGPRMSR